MCKTVILKPIFIVGLISSMTLTGIALYFPNWQAYENENGEVETRGLLKNCIQTSLNNSQDQAQLAGADNLLLQSSARDQVLLAAKEPCISVWEEAEAYVKICISLIGVSLALCTIALLWSILSFCVCCCPNLFGPIGILTLLGGFANLGAVAVFLYNTIKGDF
uniref:Transmembrane protein n=1 Tax=Bursaphelenchus xylophilus TaxID=6326 RepID=A0A1I7SI61_BURXY